MNATEQLTAWEPAILELLEPGASADISREQGLREVLMEGTRGPLHLRVLIEQFTGGEAHTSVDVTVTVESSRYVKGRYEANINLDDARGAWESIVFCAAAVFKNTGPLSDPLRQHAQLLALIGGLADQLLGIVSATRTASPAASA